MPRESYQLHSKGTGVASESQVHNQAARQRNTSEKSQYAIEQRDEEHLMRLGKKPVLKRTYGLLATVGFSCICLCTWEGSLVTLDVGLENGGPGGILYMYLLAWIGGWCTFASLCELASMAPVSSGQYFWVAMLAPRSKQRFLSYITGWMTVVGWQAVTASAVYICGTLIQGVITLTIPTYDPKNWQGTLIIWAVVCWGLFINTVARGLLPWLEGPLLMLHILLFFGHMIPVVVLSDHRSSADVWGSFNNEGGWQTQGLSTVVGILMSIYLFTGVDGVVHMSEEIKNPTINIPRAMMMSMAINGSLGFATLLTFLYALGNIDDALNSATGYPYLEILTNAIGSVPGTVALTAFSLALQIFSGTANMAAASRQLWAFARDRAVPGWSFFVHLHPYKTLPIRCIMLSAAVPALLSLINIGSSTAFNDVLGLVTAGYYGSYIVAISLLLYRRCTGAIQMPFEEDEEVVNTVGKRLTWGAWRIPGVYGIAVNTISLLYLTFALFWSFWPPEKDVKAEDMNYNVLVFGVVMMIAIVYYFIRGRKEYKGPIVEVDPSTT